MVLRVIFPKIKTLGLEIQKNTSLVENLKNDKNYILYYKDKFKNNVDNL